MRRLIRHWPASLCAQYDQGWRDLLPSFFGLVAWASVTGMAMAKSTLSIGQALSMSLLVYAGSAQLAALPLISLGVSIWTVMLTAAIVNLRFVVFSAALQPYFKSLPWWRRLMLGYLAVDVTFILFSTRFSSPADNTSVREKEAYFYGLAILNALIWQGATITGILLAQYIPDNWGLGLAGTLVLLVLLLPLVATRAGLLAALTAATVAVLTYTLPYKLNLILAVLSAVIVGFVTESIDARKTISKTASIPPSEKRNADEVKFATESIDTRNTTSTTESVHPTEKRSSDEYS